MEDVYKDLVINVAKIAPVAGEIVVVTIKSEDVDEVIVQRVRKWMNEIIPEGVKVVVFGFVPEDDVTTQVMAPKE